MDSDLLLVSTSQFHLTLTIATTNTYFLSHVHNVVFELNTVAFYDVPWVCSFLLFIKFVDNIMSATEVIRISGCYNISWMEWGGT